MKYFIIDRGDPLSVELHQRFIKLAKNYNLQLDENEPDTVLSIGGDGTMLEAFHRYKHRLEHIAFVGLHTGRLGFFADWRPEELETMVRIMAKPPEEIGSRIVQYPLLEIEICSTTGTETKLALNEFTIKGVQETMVAQLNVNNVIFEMFRGDGICISSPSGSTAYNKSLGGAVIHPSIECFQITEIASINNRVFRTVGSSLILPKHHHCDIYPQKDKCMGLSLDHLSLQRSDLVSIRVSVSEQKIKFARYRPYPFWNRVQKAFIGPEPVS
ncbi:MAG: NAD kinase [Gorillibacterium sp.]|nr:NAD kinase [Gorillibacterium sp.]